MPSLYYRDLRSSTRLSSRGKEGHIPRRRRQLPGFYVRQERRDSGPGLLIFSSKIDRDDPAGDQCVSRHDETQADDHRRADARQTLEKGTLSTPAVHERAGDYHENADRNQYDRQAETEAAKQNQTQYQLIEGHRCQQNDKSPWTGDETAGNAEPKKTAPGDLPRWIGMVVGMGLVRMVLMHRVIV